MRRHIPGLHSGQEDPESSLDGLFLVRVEKAAYRGHGQKPFLEVCFAILNRSLLLRAPSQDGCTARIGRFGSSTHSCATSVTTKNY